MAKSSSHLFASGENWAISGAIVFAVSGLVFFRKRPPDDLGGAALGRWKGYRTVAMLSPLLIVMGGVMMLVAVARGAEALWLWLVWAGVVWRDGQAGAFAAFGGDADGMGCG